MSNDQKANPTKKRRNEIEMELNDSISATIAEFRMISEPSNKDIVSFMATFMEKTQSFNEKLFELHDNVRCLEEKVSANQDENDSKHKATFKAISDLKTTLAEHSLEIENLKVTSKMNEIKSNAADQARLDNDIYLAGFPEKPNASETAEILCNKFNISPELVDYSYQFSFEQQTKQPGTSSTPNSKVSAKKIYHNLVIAFKDKSSKIKFMSAKKLHGPLKYEMMTKTQVAAKDNITIRCTNRLSKFNLRAQQVLLKAKAEGKVSGFQLHNGFQRFKRTEEGPWYRITTEDDLKPLQGKQGRGNF